MGPGRVLQVRAANTSAELVVDPEADQVGVEFEGLVRRNAARIQSAGIGRVARGIFQVDIQKATGGEISLPDFTGNLPETRLFGE